jgi:hypothetical protein
VPSFRTLLGSASTVRLLAGSFVVALLVVATFPWDSQVTTAALALVGFIFVCAALSAALAPTVEPRQDVALCALIAAFWAYAVGYARYWSTCEWFVWVDGLVISSACVYAHARLCRKSSVVRIAMSIVLFVAIVLVSSTGGTVARGMMDDPRM